MSHISNHANVIRMSSEPLKSSKVRVMNTRAPEALVLSSARLAFGISERLYRLSALIHSHRPSEAVKQVTIINGSLDSGLPVRSAYRFLFPSGGVRTTQMDELVVEMNKLKVVLSNDSSDKLDANQIRTFGDIFRDLGGALHSDVRGAHKQLVG